MSRIAKILATDEAKKVKDKDISKIEGVINVTVPYEIWVWPSGDYEFKSGLNIKGGNESDNLEEQITKAILVKEELGAE